MQNYKKSPLITEQNAESDKETPMNEELENEKFICRLEIQRKLLKNFIEMANSKHPINKEHNSVVKRH